MEYNFVVHWVEGKNHKIADTLSRYPVFAPNEEETNTEEEEKKIQKTIDTAIFIAERSLPGPAQWISSSTTLTRTMNA